MLLLALLDDKSDAGRLARVRISPQGFRSGVSAVCGGNNVASQDSEGQREALKKYTLDLTERARLGKLDPVIGRIDVKFVVRFRYCNGVVRIIRCYW